MIHLEDGWSSCQWCQSCPCTGCRNARGYKRSVATTTYCVGSHVRLGTFNGGRVQWGPILLLDEYDVDTSVLVSTCLMSYAILGNLVAKVFQYFGKVHMLLVYEPRSCELPTISIFLRLPLAQTLGPTVALAATLGAMAAS